MTVEHAVLEVVGLRVGFFSDSALWLRDSSGVAMHRWLMGADLWVGSGHSHLREAPESQMCLRRKGVTKIQSRHYIFENGHSNVEISDKVMVNANLLWKDFFYRKVSGHYSTYRSN